MFKRMLERADEALRHPLFPAGFILGICGGMALFAAGLAIVQHFFK